MDIDLQFDQPASGNIAAALQAKVKAPVPREHGAWIMLFGPVLLTFAAHPRESATRALLLCCALAAVFLVRDATDRALRARHIGVEDNLVFTAAGAALAADEVRQVGREMAARRGLDPDRLVTVSHSQIRKAHAAA